MRLSILHIVEAILNRLGLNKPEHSDSSMRNKQKFKFRLGMLKTIETPDLYSSFVEDVNETKNELATIRMTQ